MTNLTQWQLLLRMIAMTNSDRNIVDIANIADANKQVFDSQCGSVILWAVNFFPAEEPNFKAQLTANLPAYKTIVALCTPVRNDLGFIEKIRFEMLEELIEKIETENGEPKTNVTPCSK